MPREEYVTQKDLDNVMTAIKELKDDIEPIKNIIIGGGFVWRIGVGILGIIGTIVAILWGTTQIIASWFHR